MRGAGRWRYAAAGAKVTEGAGVCAGAEAADVSQLSSFVIIIGDLLSCDRGVTLAKVRPARQAAGRVVGVSRVFDR